ncbi:putative quinol monooxygenase [Shewanella waksmanii]|uniref:putative quinol monooxygenase n=1 Tax=Shewanella waksmanii TaxID=213783 RepID=UPI0037351918
MIVRVGHFQAALGKSDELYDFLQSLAEHICQSEGNLGYQVLRDEAVADKFMVIEHWQSKQAHQDSLAAYPKEQMAAVMPLFAGAPSGQYYLCES